MHCVESRSKAANLCRALEEITEETTIIFDADHHPAEDCVENFLAAYAQRPARHIKCVQGAVLVRGSSVIARMMNTVEWAGWNVYSPGMAKLSGCGNFGGAGALWESATLHQLRFDAATLTEDIDLTVRAMIEGYTVWQVASAVVTELAPRDTRSLLRQRLRWATGWEQVSDKYVWTRLWRARPRCMILMTARYISLSTALMGQAGLLINVFAPPAGPPMWYDALVPALTACCAAPMVACVWRFLILRNMPVEDWVRVHIFMLFSSLYLFFQSGMIIKARIDLCRTATPEWKITVRASEQRPEAAKGAAPFGGVAVIRADQELRPAAGCAAMASNGLHERESSPNIESVRATA